MLDLCKLIFGTVIDLLRSRATLEAEVVVLRQQINVLRRASPKRRPFGAIDRLILGGVCRLFPKSYDALAKVRPDTVIRWHRAGFRLYWRWKSRRRCGRPIVSLEIRRLIREMSVANPLWGAPRIHGELLKLGIAIGQTSVAKYMVRRRGPPSQGWKIGRSAFETARSPWQNAYAERLIGSIRRECIDHVVVFGERHLRHVMLSYKDYYNRASEHPSVYVVEEKRL